MPVYEPSTEFRVGRVPFDNTYRHVLWHGTEPLQATMMQGFCTVAYTDFKYVRNEGAVYVPANAESLYTYNYCMYKNRNYGDKWFYAFITVEYVNAATTRLTLETDVFQTWLFDWDRTAQYVLREHVADDAIGANRVPEPFQWYEQYSMNTQTYSMKTNGYAIIVETTQTPNVYGGSDTVSGETYAGIYHGTAAYVFNTYQTASVFLENIVKAGSVDAVVAVYMYPKDFLPEYTPGYPLPGSTLPYFKYFLTERPTDLHGYVPRNNKLFTYPFTYCRITDNNQHVAELAYERWTRGENGYPFQFYAPLGASAQAVGFAVLYEGVAYNYDAGFSFPLAVMCPWTYNGWDDWIASNFARYTLGAISGTLAGGISGIGTKGGPVASGLQGLAATAIGSINETLVAADSYRRVPVQFRGGYSNNDGFAAGSLGIQIETIAPIAKHAQLIDQYFDMFGYQVNEVKVPAWYTRTRWNYVQTANAAFRGNVPADAMAAINGIFDSGVTLWHTSQVGDYSLSNDMRQ